MKITQPTPPHPAPFFPEAFAMAATQWPRPETEPSASEGQEAPEVSAIAVLGYN